MEPALHPVSCVSHSARPGLVITDLYSPGAPDGLLHFMTLLTESLFSVSSRLDHSQFVLKVNLNINQKSHKKLDDQATSPVSLLSS